jgi:RNA-directed DNA polymerase
MLMAFRQKLGLISGLARKDRRVKFNNLQHLVNEWSLKWGFRMLNRTESVGIDRISLKAYEENMDSNVEDLLNRMKRMSYRPQAARRVYIPKGNGKARPLGILTVEDRMVQKVMSRILEAVYEEDFKDFSYGFRPGRNQHQAIAKLNEILTQGPVNYVIDADIKGFFDNVNHEALKSCLEKRISDRKFIRYVIRFLKSGVMEEGKYLKTRLGTPQGGVISPVLANVYLHYALDVWFEEKAKSELRGYAAMVRFADDCVICVKYKSDADHLLTMLKERMKRCHLELSEEKTRLVCFGRYAFENWKRNRRNRKRSDKDWQKPGTFSFLGFTHYCTCTPKGRFKIGRKTEKKRFNGSLKRVKAWLKKTRNQHKLKEIWEKISQKLVGHYRYFGVSGNYRSLGMFYFRIVRLLFKWLNRRSQKKSYNWEEFNKYLKAHSLPRPKIFCNLFKLVQSQGATMKSRMREILTSGSVRGKVSNYAWNTHT